MDTFDVKTLQQLKIAIKSTWKQANDTINYMLDNKINTVEKIQEKFKNLIIETYKPKHDSEIFNRSLNAKTIIDIKNKIIDLIGKEIDEISYPSLYSLLFEKKYGWKEMENLIHTNYLLMKAFAIDIFNKLPQNVQSLRQLKVLLKKWKIENIDVLLERLFDAKNEFTNYYDCYKYLQNNPYKKLEVTPWEQFGKDFKNLPKNKQQQLFEIINSLLDITSAVQNDHNEENLKIYDEFKNKMSDLINNFNKKIKDNLRKKWDKQNKNDLKKIGDEYN